MPARKSNVVQLRLFKDLPEVPQPDSCSLCKGERVVYREERVVNHKASYGRCRGQSVEPFEVDVVTVVGGIDACPECSAKAEAEFRSQGR